eukprot:Hpha_TRINITY_DN15271_c4_g16::TRINITY_DN15271_c4_g16_i1::g.67399::m.67399
MPANTCPVQRTANRQEGGNPIRSGGMPIDRRGGGIGQVNKEEGGNEPDRSTKFVRAPQTAATKTLVVVFASSGGVGGALHVLRGQAQHFLLQGGDEYVGVSRGEHHRGLDNHHVVERAIEGCQDLVFVLQPGTQQTRFLLCRFPAPLARHEIDTDEQTAASHLPDVTHRLLRQPPLDVEEGFAEMGAHSSGLLLKALLLYGLHHCQSGSCTYRVPTECVEVLRALRKCLGDCLRARDGGEGHAIAERFAHGHDIRLDPLLLEPPETRTKTAEPGLDLIGDAHPPLGPHVLITLGEVARRRQDDTSNAHAGFDEEGRYVPPEVFDCILHVLGVQLRRVVPSVLTTEGVRAPHLPDVGKLPNPVLVFVFVRRQGYRSIRMTVVRPVDHHTPLLPSVALCQPHRKVIRLAAGVHEEYLRELGRQGTKNLLGESDHGLMKITSVGVELLHLLSHSLHYCWAAVAAVRHVVTRVQEAPASDIEQVLTLPPHHPQRLRVLVAHRHRRARDLPPPRE